MKKVLMVIIAGLVFIYVSFAVINPANSKQGESINFSIKYWMGTCEGTHGGEKELLFLTLMI